MYTPKQAEVMLNANSRWNILEGAVRSGKTYVSYDLILKRIFQLPKGAMLMIGRTQQTLEKNVINPMREKLGGAIVSTVNHKNECTIAGRKFYVTGADNREAAAKIQGLGLVYAYGDEVTTWNEAVFQMLKSRISDAGAMFDGTCNPETPDHWLMTDLLEKPDLDVYRMTFTIDDNSFLEPEFVANLKKEYTGVYYDRYILGKWVRAEGAIYTAFISDNAKYIIDEAPKPNDLFIVNIGVDFGGNKSATCFHATGIKKNMSGVVVLSEKYSRAGTDNPTTLTDSFVQFCKSIRERYPMLAMAYCDSAESVLINGLRDGIARAGVGVAVKNAVKGEINDRIRGVNRLFGTDKIKIMDSCTHLIKSLNNAVYDEKKVEDTRLDDLSYEVDPLDSFEYSIEPYIKQVLRMV